MKCHDWTPNENKSAMISKQPTLGKGTPAMEVSALGFGVMGMNYHGGPFPAKKPKIKLALWTVERGITLLMLQKLMSISLIRNWLVKH